jgi:predicted dehydrogenase
MVSLHGGDDARVAIAREAEVERRQLPRPDNAPLVDDVARAVIEDRPPRFTGRDGMKATQTVEAVFRSSHSGGWVGVA